MLSAIILSGGKISQAKTTVYTATTKQASINVADRRCGPVTRFPSCIRHRDLPDPPVRVKSIPWGIINIHAEYLSQNPVQIGATSMMPADISPLSGTRDKTGYKFMATATPY
jgi:hypothetical protein